METQYYKEYSPALDREMEVKVYGHAGRPILFIPCQDGKYVDFENFKMTDYWGPYIEAGQAMVFSIDTIDLETYSNTNGDPRWKIERHEQWISYICNEMVPFMQAMCMERNGWDQAPGVFTFGCSLGATHALNLALRRPDIINGCLALSGIYDTHYGWGDYMDDLVYMSSPVHNLENLPMDHPYVDMYNNNQIIVCVGQGPWEIPDSTIRIKQLFEEKGINAWVDVWGHDVQHDWCWWYKQVEYFLPYIFN